MPSTRTINLALSEADHKRIEDAISAAWREQLAKAERNCNAGFIAVGEAAQEELDHLTELRDRIAEANPS